MRYINQKQYPHIPYITRANPEYPGHERGKTTTISSSGCGLCSAIMVADRLLPTYNFELEDAIALSYQIPANRKAGTSRDFFPVFAEKLGLMLEQSGDIGDLLRCLRTGGAAIVHVGSEKDGKSGLFTRGGHYMAVVNEEPDGRVAILDPSHTPTKFEEEDRKGRVEIVNDVIVLCTPEVLNAEIKDDGYFLFWRK
jgi:hypothetical protein